jgi:hypothetical protein
MLLRADYSTAALLGKPRLGNRSDFSINSYLPSLLLLPAAIHAVLTDVVRVDLASGREQRKVFLSGA